jgi:ActR/RegA family two-component response regulator
MDGMGSLLLVDDEGTFRESTSRLLRRQGFQCQCAADADEGVRLLRCSRFDLLIADIRMPANPDLRLVREAREQDHQMPVILITGYPSVDTAIRSVGLSVVAYLTKPLAPDDLFRHVRSAIGHSRKRQAVTAIRGRLQSCLGDLESAQSKPIPRAGGKDELISIGTIRTLAACLSELLGLCARPDADRGVHDLCELLDCPQRPVCRDAIVDTIAVLKRTKESFKSKDLAELRTKLEGLFRPGTVPRS